MILSSLYSDMASSGLRSCLISRQGELVFEYYRDQQTPAEAAKINSCTKSILSALICIAMDQGLLPQPETPASVFFPQLALDLDPRKQDMTLQHLLTMSAGFNWTEFGGQNSFPRMTRSPNWVEFVLEQALSDAPGARMEYNSGVSQLLSALLVQATGMTTARFAELHLFEPLGIETYKWESDPQGIHTGGFGLWLRPADMLKFGQLYLQQGEWERKSLISSELVSRSVQPAIVGEAPRRGSYGWHWWVDSYAAKSADLETLTPDATSAASSTDLDYYYARGYAGQFIYVIPRLETVVVLTNDQQKKGQPPVDVFREFVAPLLASQA